MRWLGQGRSRQREPKQIDFMGDFDLVPGTILNTNTVHMHNLPSDDGLVGFADVM